MTHFFSADNPQHDYLTLQQLEKFTDCIRILETAGYKLPWVHAANSYGSLRFPQADFNMVRIGLGLFGLLPNLDLKPAVSLTSRIVGINTMLKGETVSYAGTYTVARDLEKIAVLPLGYCDGLHTQYSGRGYAVIRDKKALFVGRICMDFMMVDITDIPEASIGDSALIFGKDLFGHFIDPAQLAEAGGTHVYQLLTCLGPRIRRIFTYDEAF
jgi:alanine racemase/UDP-N-acetylmuramoyl-tripeptide--D-alanyl-D-alanine ligase